jgi:hypothetical protein
VHKYTPANVPGLPAGWEINHDEKYNNLSLWRVIAYLKDYQEDREGYGALLYSGSRWSDAYLPHDYTQEDFDEAMQELVCKAEWIDANLSEERWWDWLPKGTDRPTRSDYFRKLR